MKKNKVAMTLVLSAVSAIVAAPLLLKEDSEKLSISNEDSESEIGQYFASQLIIDVKKNNKIDLPNDEKDALVAEVKTLLKREISTEELRDGYSLVLKGYGQSDLSIESEIYNELSLTFGDDDSTNAGGIPKIHPNQPNATVSFCHTACHYACHGSRGWR